MPIGGLFNIGTPTDTWFSTNSNGDSLVFTLTSGNITAIGGYFFVTDFDGDVTSGTVSAALNDGTTYSVTDPTL
jgi:hypothetical protein